MRSHDNWMNYDTPNRHIIISSRGESDINRFNKSIFVKIRVLRVNIHISIDISVEYRITLYIGNVWWYFILLQQQLRAMTTSRVRVPVDEITQTRIRYMKEQHPLKNPPDIVFSNFSIHPFRFVVPGCQLTEVKRKTPSRVKK